LRFLVDSSVFASIIVRDEHYERAKKFLFSGVDAELATVDLAFVEVANTLWKHTYMLNRIPADAFHVLADAVESLIRSSTKRIYSSAEYLGEALDNALRFGITVYDAVYVTAALKHGCRLATFDEKLDKILKSRGLDITYIP